VAVSRAIKSLTIVGSVHALAGDKNWAKLVEGFRHQGKVKPVEMKSLESSSVAGWARIQREVEQMSASAEGSGPHSSFGKGNCFHDHFLGGKGCRGKGPGGKGISGKGKGLGSKGLPGSGHGFGSKGFPGSSKGFGGKGCDKGCGKGGKRVDGRLIGGVTSGKSGKGAKGSHGGKPGKGNPGGKLGKGGKGGKGGKDGKGSITSKGKGHGNAKGSGWY